jgi:hypothetical protein
LKCWGKPKLGPTVHQAGDCFLTIQVPAALPRYGQAIQPGMVLWALRLIFGAIATLRAWNRLYAKQKRLRSNTHINNYNFVFSDVKIKSNIKSIENPLNILLQLNGKKYDMLPDNQGLHKEQEKKEKKDEYGFIAQEFMEVLPELTIFDTLTNLYAINYTGLIPILVEALKYQQVEIDELKRCT